MISARLLSLRSAAVVGVLLSACRDVGPVVAARVDFLAQPPASVANSQTLAPVTVGFLTADGEIVTTATGDVQISLLTADTAARLSGTTTVTAVNGLAAFSDLSLTAKAGAGYRLVAKTTALDSVVSSPFEITVGPAAKLRFDGQVTNPGAGTTLPPVTVSVLDAGGNLVSNVTSSITIGAGPPVFGTTTVAAVAGVATFRDLSIRQSGFTALTASSPGLPSAASANFFVWPGPLTRLAFGAQPANGTAGKSLPSFSFRCTDDYGNLTATPPGGGMTVTVALGNNPTGATLSGTLTVSGFAAITSFNNVSIDKPGTGYTLVASAVSPGMCSGAPPVTSTSFNVLP